MAVVRKTVLLAAVGALLAPLAVAHAVPTPERRAVKPVKKRVTVETVMPGSLSSLGGFTPSLVNPARAADIRPQTAERIFRFTPSGRQGDRKALTLGLSTRTETRAEAALKPAQTAYNVGASIGWLGFELAGGYTKVETPYGPRREGVDLGLSYRGKRWQTSLLAAAEQPSHLAPMDPLNLDRRASLELGGAYSLSSRLSLSAGARYQLITPLDPRLEREGDPSVFVGTAFSF
jgi:hypothetical protein